MLHHLAGATCTIQIANIVNYNCHQFFNKYSEQAGICQICMVLEAVDHVREQVRTKTDSMLYIRILIGSRGKKLTILREI